MHRHVLYRLVIFAFLSALCGCQSNDPSVTPVDCGVSNGGCEQLCVEGGEGDVCDCEIGYVLGDDGLRCDDVNECLDPDACGGGDCVNSIGGYSCSCHDGFAGEKCETCEPGYYGSLCEICDTECLFGTCDDGVGGDGGCLCQTGYVGDVCELPDPNNPPADLRLRVLNDKGQERTLVLSRYSVRTHHSLWVKIVDPDGFVGDAEVEDALRTYRGYCEEESDASVSAMVLPSGSIRFHVFKGDPHEDWGFIPAEEYDPAEPEIVYSLVSGAPEPPSGVPVAGASFTDTASPGDPYDLVAYRAHLSLIITRDYLETFAYPDVATIVRKAESSIARINAVMIRDLLTEIHVGEILIREDVMTDWEAGREDVQTHFPGAQPNSVFSVTNEFGSGLAYMCMNGGPTASAYVNGYATSKVGPGDDGTWYGVMRHEYGHSLGSDHYEGGSPEGPTIMSGNSLSRFSKYEHLAIMACRQGGDGDAARFAEYLGDYSAALIPPYAALDDGYVLDPDDEGIFLDVLANDHDVNGDAIAIGGFPEVSSLGGVITLSAASGPQGRDQLYYQAPDLGMEGVMVPDCGSGQILDPLDCDACIPHHMQEDITCTTSADCPEGGICVGERCRVTPGCTDGTWVDACGRPCPSERLLLWFDTSDLSNLEDVSGTRGGALIHDSEIARCLDQSGHGRDARVFVEGRAPRVQRKDEAMISDRATLRFTDDFMEIRNIDLRAETEPVVTSIAVARHEGGDWGQVVWVQNQNGFDKRTHKTVGKDAAEPGVSSLRMDAAGPGFEHWINGMALAGDPANTLEPGGEGIGLGALLYAHEGYEGAYHNGLILGELLIFSGALGDSERRQIESYLIKKWDIPLGDRFWYTTVDASGLAGKAPVHIDFE